MGRERYQRNETELNTETLSLSESFVVWLWGFVRYAKGNSDSHMVAHFTTSFLQGAMTTLLGLVFHVTSPNIAPQSLFPFATVIKSPNQPS